MPATLVHSHGRRGHPHPSFLGIVGKRGDDDGGGRVARVVGGGRVAGVGVGCCHSLPLCHCGCECDAKQERTKTTV